MTIEGTCYFYTHFGAANSILMSNLTTHYSLLKNLSYRRHRRAIVHICQKTRKGDFEPSEENAKITNPLIVKQIQNYEKPFENTRKKDLSVS